MNYGFIIDNRSCIGCHACSTACKSENEVPLGVYRTWVKYTETGTYPDSRRHFQVTRCNHCSNPPCVRICPTGAMYQRADGIVEFNKDNCIACKSCMQACPYDAIYLDPETKTAAKCHYCAHKVEVGMEPSCVVVCPTHAIISGDLDDPESEISRTLAKEKVTVRKPEQGTAPKVFYIEGASVNLVPTAVERTPETFMWADVKSLHHGEPNHPHGPHTPPASTKDRDGVEVRVGQPQGEPVGGPIRMGERVAGHMVQVAYNAQHNIQWHWQVPAYLVTKGIAAGTFMLMALAWMFGAEGLVSPMTFITGNFLVSAMMAATTGFLIWDLDQPTRFLYILMRPQWRSWLTRGAIFLIGFSTISGLWMVVEGADLMGWIEGGLAEQARPFFIYAGLPLALGAAIYTAFLFGQAEGRDLWQSTALPLHLVVQAMMMGSAGVLLMSLVPEAVSDGMFELARIGLLVFIALDIFVTLFAELGMSHASIVAAKAAHEIKSGRYKNHFWWGSIGLGHAVPFALALACGVMASPALGALAAVTTMAGLYFYEHAFVMAPQEVPNS